MNPKSAKTLVWAAVISIIIGMAVMSPAGNFFLYAIAALFAAIPAIFGATKRTRIAAIIVLALSFLLLAVTYPRFSTEMTRYMERAHKKSSEGAAPQTLPQHERK